MDSQLNELEYLLHKCKLEKDITKRADLHLQIIDLKVKIKDDLMSNNKLYNTLIRLKMVGLL